MKTRFDWQLTCTAIQSFLYTASSYAEFPSLSSFNPVPRNIEFPSFFLLSNRFCPARNETKFFSFFSNYWLISLCIEHTELLAECKEYWSWLINFVSLLFIFFFFNSLFCRLNFCCFILLCVFDEYYIIVNIGFFFNCV